MGKHGVQDVGTQDIQWYTGYTVLLGETEDKQWYTTYIRDNTTGSLYGDCRELLAED